MASIDELNLTEDGSDVRRQATKTQLHMTRFRPANGPGQVAVLHW